MNVVLGNPVMNRKVDVDSVCDIRNLSFCVFFFNVNVVVGTPVMARKAIGDFVCVYDICRSVIC